MQSSACVLYPRYRVAASLNLNGFDGRLRIRSLGAEKFSRCKSGEFGRSAHTSDSNDVGSRPQGDVTLLRILPDIFERIIHRSIEFLSDAIERPAIVLPILDPFKIAHCDAPRVGQNIRQDNHATLMQLLVGAGMNWAVGGLDDHRGR